ncbi:hypothetical protein K437DRAFT_258321 [Tilletiaria anomala UBC 951]|uniref:S1 motif domain-containing protein n=1 Tax=Tilletiaria anomala (strain ATCC 24038 / CBS 436.72 / UBC 951) TaxID=1037660 RepID=A0A066VI05_TILAU|nr:uncharacterized protein K437DRAFT_258321 [Tilletiaria anomala UBC 951]KDN41332.1 hypothetical protein K437DRAFT_258321 [Tilletiaria anomala UBC 951]
MVTSTTARADLLSIFPLSLSAPRDPSTSSYLHLSGYEKSSSGAYTECSAGDGDEYDDDEFLEDDDELMDEAEDDLDGEAGPSMLGTGGRITTAGEAIASSSTFMRGHGSYLAASMHSSSRRTEGAQEDHDEGQAAGAGGASAPAVAPTTPDTIYSSLAGLVHRTNRLISVRPLRARYAPEVGDLVVGRVTEVQPGTKRWRVDIHSRQDATLLLSSINLPGGVQRKKLESDELQMRTFFKEGDLLVAEVQSVFNDGSVGLHTRSLRYGKLRNGDLAVVQPGLIQRLKSHFVFLERANIDITLGMNGYVWCAKHILFDVDVAESEGKAGGGAAAGAGAGVGTGPDALMPVYEGQGIGGQGIGMDVEAGAGVYGDQNEDISISTRTAISRVAAILKLLSARHMPISDATISKAYELWVDNFLTSPSLTAPAAKRPAGRGTDAIGASMTAGVEAAREQESLLYGAKGDKLVELLYRVDR